jgi:signal transduction histidine kinase
MAVVLALLVLLVVPAAIEHRLAGLRDSLAAGEHARAVVNDFEASFATELLLRRGAVGSRGVTPDAASKLDADVVELRATLHEIDGMSLARFDSLSNLLAIWRTSTGDGSGTAASHGLRLIASAETLDAYLTEFVVRQRQGAMGLSRYDVFIPAILAPIALLGMMVSMWSARRLQLFAKIADDEREETIRASQSRAALLRGVTHDVKNPLGAANGYAQILEEGIVGALEPQQADMVHRIRRLLDVSIQTVTDLLELARADGTLHLEYSTTDLASIMTEVVEDHRGMAQEHGVTIEATGQATPVVTDPVRVRQILTNLVSNAIKYTPEGGQVGAHIVHRAPSGGRAQVGIAVEDTGPGIPRELESKVFDEFFRVRGNEGSSGNGLGLAISRRIGRLLGGDVTYAPRDEVGSVFTAWLPDARSSAIPSTHSHS